MTNQVTLPPIFCPKCRVYLGRRQACQSCGWERPAPLDNPATLAACFTHDQPFLAAPLILGADAASGAPARLVAGYGRRGDNRGGVLALDMAQARCTWPVALDAAVTGVALAPDGATLIVGDDAGRLHALHSGDGRPRWPAPTPLEDAIEAPPLLPVHRNEPQMAVATETGLLALVDWRTGRCLRTFDLGAELKTPVRVAATPARWGNNVLVSVLARQRNAGGALVCLEPTGHLAVIATTAAGLYTTPLLLPGERTAVVGTNDGDLLAIDLLNGTTKWRCSAGKQVRAAPALDGGRLYVGSGARRLLAIDAASGHLHWGLTWSHSINTTPTVVDGLLIVADSAGGVAAFDLAAIEEMARAQRPDGAAELKVAPLWVADLEQDARGQAAGMPTAAVLGGFVLHQGELWCGSANGRLYRFPLHGRQWAWAGDQARRHARWLDAAAAFVWADAHNGEAQAADLLAEQGEMEQAALLYQALDRLTDAARCYEKAAEQKRLPILWERAAALWWRLRQPQRAHNCEEQAAVIGRRPLLQITCLALSPVKVDERALLRLQVDNRGASRARKLRIELVSTDFAPHPAVDCPELTPQSPGLDCQFFLDAQGAGQRHLEVRVHAEDEHGNPLPVRSWREVVQVAAAHQPPVQVHVDKLFSGPATITEVTGDVGLIRQARPETP